MKKEIVILITLFILGALALLRFAGAFTDPTPTLTIPTPTLGISLPTPTRGALPGTLTTPTPTSNFFSPRPTATAAPNSPGLLPSHSPVTGGGSVTGPGAPVGEENAPGQVGGASTALPNASLPGADMLILLVLGGMVLSGLFLYIISRRRGSRIRKLGLAVMFAGAVGVGVPLLPFALSTFGGNNFKKSEVLAESKKSENLLVMGRIGIEIPLIKSDDERALNNGAWIYPGASTPGLGANTVIFGHRFKYLPPLSDTFYSLSAAKIGDEFFLSWEGKIYNYRVVQIKSIEANDFSVMAQGGGERVTLITCTPLFSSRQRLVVVGEPLN
jgi:sortase A